MKTVDDILKVTQDSQMLKIPANLHTALPLAEQGLDSLDLIMLLHEVEKHFNVRIPQEATSQLRSLQDIANFLNVKG